MRGKRGGKGMKSRETRGRGEARRNQKTEKKGEKRGGRGSERKARARRREAPRGGCPRGGGGGGGHDTFPCGHMAPGRRRLPSFPRPPASRPRPPSPGQAGRAAEACTENKKSSGTSLPREILTSKCHT